MKIQIKLSWLMVLSSVIIALCYPISVQAAILVQKSDLTAPFIFSWLGVWVFSGAINKAAADSFAGWITETWGMSGSSVETVQKIGARMKGLYQGK